MGREIMRIARNLNGRVQKVEEEGAASSSARIAALEQKIERDLTRHAEAVDRRLTQADDQHALALERLGDEISRISDRLSERIAQSERRSAQALDDIGRRLSESTDRIQQRHEHASGELAERMRQSEERTARLLAEARGSIEQRSDRDVRRAPPLESPDPTPWTPAETANGDWRATAFADAADDWSVDDATGVLDDGAALAERGDVFADSVFEDAPTSAEADADRAPPPFGQVAPDPWAHADEDLFGGADVNDILKVTGGFEPEPASAPARDDDGFSADLEFVSPTPPSEELTRPSTTRDVLEAAPAPMTPADAAETRQGFVLARRGGKSKLQERLDKQAGRQNSTMRTALSAMAVAALGVAGGYATLQVAGGSGLTLPGGFTLAPDAVDGGAAPAATTAPIAALALDASPTDAVPSPDAAATEGAGLFARAVQMLDNGDDSGLEPLTRAANLGYAPAQLRLASLYQDGAAGLAADETEARAWARRAAEAGDAKAMHFYAMQMYDGVGGARNRVDALNWLTKAASAGAQPGRSLQVVYDRGAARRSAGPGLGPAPDLGSFGRRPAQGARSR